MCNSHTYVSNRVLRAYEEYLVLNAHTSPNSWLQTSCLHFWLGCPLVLHPPVSSPFQVPAGSPFSDGKATPKNAPSDRTSGKRALQIDQCQADGRSYLGAPRGRTAVHVSSSASGLPDPSHLLFALIEYYCVTSILMCEVFMSFFEHWSRVCLCTVGCKYDSKAAVSWLGWRAQGTIAPRQSG